MGFKYVYKLLKNQASIVRICSSKNEPIAVEYELAIKVLKRHARQDNEENPGTANNNRVMPCLCDSCELLGGCHVVDQGVKVFECKRFSARA